MFKWKKLGPLFNPLLQGGNGWMHEYAQAPSVVAFDDRLRVFFSSRPKPENGQYVSRMAYIDLDKSDLFHILHIAPEPVLPLGGRGEFDEFGTYPVSSIRHGNEIRAYYAGWTRCESVPFNAAIGLAISTDGGDSFRRYGGGGPVLSYSPDEPFVLGSPKIRRFGDIWYLWYSAGTKWVKTAGRPEPVYKIRMATSADGIHWNKIGRPLLESLLEEDECQAGADVFFHGGRYHMFFSYRYALDFRAQGKGYRIGHAHSQDLLNWTRDDAAAGLIASDSGWDAESVSYPHVFDLDGRLHMLYQGNEIGRFGFGLAQLEQN
ncbi:hypothetical protein [Herbaspirillum sp. NPDC087042]|uniref:hypothetical protein n=1 Tax=Herbaspirillum sp. NPDC087042 TaxID=3364004 RepID=UPI0037FAC369